MGHPGRTDAAVVPSTGADLPLLSDPDRLVAARRLAAAVDEAEGLDRLTRLAAMLLEAQYAQVSLLTDEQVVASVHGLERAPESWTGPAQESLCAITIATGGPLVVPDTTRDERVSGLTKVVDGGVKAYLGIPLVDGQDLRVGALCVFDDRPRTFSDEQVRLLTELARTVVAELELRVLTREARGTAARLGLALDAADIGSFDLDIEAQALVWDDRLKRIFGYDFGGFDGTMDSFSARVHPEDRSRVAAAVQAATDSRGELGVEYRIRRPDGSERWVLARGRVLHDGRGSRSRLLGVAYDSTQLRESRDAVARVLETMTDAFYSLDRDWRFTYVNAEAERFLQRSPADLVGRGIWQEFPDAEGAGFRAEYERAVALSQPSTFEAEYPGLGWFELRLWPTPDGLSVYFRDIGARRRAEVEREQAIVDRESALASAAAANTRLTMLADASNRLAASLEPAQVLETLSALVVPRLGAWVAIALRGETATSYGATVRTTDPAGVHVVHVAHASPDGEALLGTFLDSAPLSTRDPVGVGHVVATGLSEWLPEVPDSALVGLARGDERILADLRDLAPRSALTLPLASRGRMLGALTVAEPTGGSIDRALLADLAGRAAVALDNALLYGAERRDGITLQRSLLPRRLPVLPGVSAAARYLPGASGAFVGGDWYQGVRVGDGLVLAMGDVMGHGMRSAARMGQLRAIVATLALEGHSPGRLLTRLAESTEVLLDLELATLIVAAYDPATRQLTVASAGHPPPLLAPLDEAPRYLEVDPGPPIGTVPGRYPEIVATVPAGSTLVLYTDGLVENRDESLEDGLARLREALVELRLPPEAVCDHVLRRLGRERGADDDVALLVISHEP